MNKYRKKTMATLLIAIFMISAFSVAMPVNALPPVGVVGCEVKPIDPILVGQALDIVVVVTTEYDDDPYELRVWVKDPSGGISAYLVQGVGLTSPGKVYSRVYPDAFGPYPGLGYPNEPTTLIVGTYEVRTRAGNKYGLGSFEVTDSPILDGEIDVGEYTTEISIGPYTGYIANDDLNLYIGYDFVLDPLYDFSRFYIYKEDTFTPDTINCLIIGYYQTGGFGAHLAQLVDGTGNGVFESVSIAPTDIFNYDIDEATEMVVPLTELNLVVGDTVKIGFQIEGWNDDGEFPDSFVSSLLSTYSDYTLWEPEPTLTINIVGEGWVDPLIGGLPIPDENGDPIRFTEPTNTLTVSAGTVVVLWSLPDTGYEFGSWTGDVEEFQGGIPPENIQVTMTADKTATATFTLIPPEPPVLSNLVITPSEINLGDSVTISIDITNPNDQSITYLVIMQIGTLTVPVEVELEPSESKTVSHTITPDAVGEYIVTVDELTGSFTVSHSPDESVDLTVYVEVYVTPVISISVDPTSIDFGFIVQGEVSDPKHVIITSNSDVIIDVIATITGTDITFFESCLMINDAIPSPWPGLVETGVEPGTTFDVDLGLDLSSWGAVGSYSGTLVFWATATT